MADLIDFEMVRHVRGYELVESGPKKAATGPATRLLAPRGPFLIPKGKAVETYRPLEGFPALFRELADLRKEPPAILKFANRFGLLSLPKESPRSIREDVSDWYELIDRMREAIEARERQEWWRLTSESALFGRADIRLVAPQGDAPARIKIVPWSLRSALWIQFATATAANARLKACEQCGKWFQHGTGTGRRKTARFCADACRKAWHLDHQEVAR